MPEFPQPLEMGKACHHAHIVMEEASVYPLAEMLPSRDDLAGIGACMAQRRG